MIHALVKEIVDNFLKIPFSYGKREDAAAFDSDGKEFVWLYPVRELYDFDSSNSIYATYATLIDFAIPGEVKPGTVEEQDYINRMRPFLITFLQKLKRHEAVKEVTNATGDPFFPFRSENYYGMQLNIRIKLRMPYAKC